MALVCPACRKIHLKAYTDKNTGLEIDACPKCWGLWFDSNELGHFFTSEQLKSRFFLPEDVMPAQSTGFIISTKTRPCPRCMKAMQEKLFGDVSVDICQNCLGIWLDDGELQRIVKQYHKGARNEKTVAGELDKALGYGHEGSSNLGAILVSVLSFFGLKK